LPELRSFNKKDSNYLKKISNTLSTFERTGASVYFKQKIDSWGASEIPAELKGMSFYPSVLHQDSNVFGEDNITRRAVITISGNETLEYRISQLINPNIDRNQLLGSYYNEVADANFVLFKYSDNILKGDSVRSIPFYKTITSDDFLNSLKNKIVIVGTRFNSNSGDFKMAPGGFRVSKNELTAEIAASLSSGNTVKILSRFISFASAMIVSIIMIVSVFYTKPSNGIVIFIATTLFILFFSYMILGFTGYYFRVSETLLLGVITYYLCTPFRSILENKRNFVLREEARILKEVDELKRNFVSLMSHDLKTPVAKIASVVELLKLENHDRQIYMELEKIEQSTVQLNDFISSILDLTKMESSNFELNLMTVDLNKVVEKVSSSLGDQIVKNNIHFNKDLDVLFPITIDEDLTIRVINNLLENAIKYAGDGSIVKISTKDQGDMVELTVEDNGVGIDEKEVKYIFEKFYRVKNDLVSGNGLGLYLVKYFVELMNGEIQVLSKVGQGTKFSVFFKNS
jgi:signal transduction histidine kinase